MNLLRGCIIYAEEIFCSADCPLCGRPLYVFFVTICLDSDCYNCQDCHLSLLHLLLYAVLLCSAIEWIGVAATSSAAVALFATLLRRSVSFGSFFFCFFFIYLFFYYYYFRLRQNKTNAIKSDRFNWKRTKGWSAEPSADGAYMCIHM